MNNKHTRRRARVNKVLHTILAYLRLKELGVHDLPMQQIGFLPCLLQVPCLTKLLEKGNSPLLQTSSGQTSIHVTPPKTTIQLHWQAARSNDVTHANDNLYAYAGSCPAALWTTGNPRGCRHLLMAPLRRSKVAVHTFLGWSQAGLLRQPSYRNYRKP